MQDYRECEQCDHRNDASYIECENCGADISFISPTYYEQEVSMTITNKEMLKSEPSNIEMTSSVNEETNRATALMTRIKLISAKENLEIQLPLSDVILGRDGDLVAEVFNKSNFVSRRHATIKFRSGSYFIIDLTSHNGTFLNYSRLNPGKEYKLTVGENLTIADVEFRIQSC